MTDNASPEFAELVSEALASALLNVHVAGPGIVQSYDAAKQTCTVQPATRRPITTEEGALEHETPAAVQNVPVAFPGAAGFSLHWPLAKGDAVLLVYCDYSPNGWRSRGQISDAGDTRKSGPSYPIAVPWMRPNGGPGADTDKSIGTPGGLRLHFGASAISAGNGANFVALANKVLTELNDIRTKFDSHTHLYNPGPSAPAPSLPPTAPMGPAQPVASANLKAD